MGIMVMLMLIAVGAEECKSKTNFDLLSRLLLLFVIRLFVCYYLSIIF